MMYCTQCGVNVRDTDRFCSHCGYAFTGQPPTGSAPPEFAPQPPRRLERSVRDKSIAGVCAGFAHYIGVDVIVVRVVWLCTAIFTGVGFIAYLVCWIVMPKEQPEYGPARQTPPVTAPPPPPKTPPAEVLQTEY